MNARGNNKMNRIQKFAVILAATLLAAGTSHAMSVSWSAANTRFVTLQGGALGVPQGDLIELGIANVSGIQAATSGTAAQAAFTTWSAGFVGDGVGLDGTFAESTTAPGLTFLGQQLYIIVFNAATAASASQVGVFTNPAWIAPATDSAPALVLDIGDAGTVATRGALSSGTVTSPAALAGSDAASLAIVPEPSSIALVVTGLLGLVTLARSRRS